MITVLFRIGLYVSSFFPLYVLLIVDNYKYFTSWKKLKDIFLFNNFLPSIFSYVLTILIVLSFVSIFITLRISLNEKHQFVGIYNTEDNLLSYVVTYLVPILSIDITKANSLLVNLGLFSLLGFIYVKNSLVYLNPLFLFFKYNVFLTEKNEVLISDFDIYDLKNIEGERVRTRVLSYKIYLVRKKDSIPRNH
ncbi:MULTISPECIES: hypothetical protein [unclassified Bacillus (in: firmicutes)]|uniref:hypothetical protein n=1 Tax=unclassified Bacillus (in: firmicutes) TaxID=185979 RepID=UPI001BE5A5B1|nr:MULTISPECIES: hypothetical protein [unclassified Bacillus (in: firmicutes)]MBT2613852.1 hypothetical protein [Bacillus sp. ISL-78]MBT2627730.1 hypothetical protein [Bacillus sp. ISL-101]